MTINAGDVVEIECKGICKTGNVISANWYKDGGWYIEMTAIAKTGTHYVYWKQYIDGGTVELVIKRGE